MYVLTSRSDKRISVRIAGSRDHAFSVHQQLMEYSGFPSDLELHEEVSTPPRSKDSWPRRVGKWLTS